MGFVRVRLLDKIFFFKQKTAYEVRISDWSSDVCSSDLSWPTTSAVGLPRSSRDTARIGTVRPLDLVPSTSSARAYMPGSSSPRGVGNTARPTWLPVVGSTLTSVNFITRTEERRGGNEWVRTLRIRWSQGT